MRRQLFHHLFVKYRHALRRYVGRFIGPDAADEIVQETFLRAYVHPEEMRAPKAFLFATAHNLAVKSLRHRQVAAARPLGDNEETGVYAQVPGVEQELVAEEELRVLKEAIDQLPGQCRAVFKLRMFHRRSYKEIARELGISPRTVEKHVARAILGTHAYLQQRYDLRGADSRSSNHFQWEEHHGEARNEKR